MITLWQHLCSFTSHLLFSYISSCLFLVPLFINVLLWPLLYLLLAYFSVPLCQAAFLSFLYLLTCFSVRFFIASVSLSVPLSLVSLSVPLPLNLLSCPFLYPLIRFVPLPLNLRICPFLYCASSYLSVPLSLLKKKQRSLVWQHLRSFIFNLLIVTSSSVLIFVFTITFNYLQRKKMEKEGSIASLIPHERTIEQRNVL